MVHWYRDCAVASKTTEVGLSPTWITRVNGPPRKKCPRRKGWLRKIESYPILL